MKKPVKSARFIRSYPRVLKTKVIHNITISPEDAAYLRIKGKGNLSKGVREAVKTLRKTEESEG